MVDNGNNTADYVLLPSRNTNQQHCVSLYISFINDHNITSNTPKNPLYNSFSLRTVSRRTRIAPSPAININIANSILTSLTAEPTRETQKRNDIMNTQNILEWVQPDHANYYTVTLLPNTPAAGYWLWWKYSIARRATWWLSAAYGWVS